MILFLTMTRQTGLNVAEAGTAIGALGGVIVLLGGMTPFGRRVGMVLGGLGVAVGFLLLLAAVRWGHFGSR